MSQSREVTQKDKLAELKKEVEPTGARVKRKMKEFILDGTRLAFNTSLNATNRILRKFGVDLKKVGGDDEITRAGIVVAVAPMITAGVVCAAASPFVVGYSQMRKAYNKLSEKEVEWMQLYGIPLIKNCNEEQMNSFVNALLCQENSSRVYFHLLSNYNLRHKKENCIRYICDINNNGTRSYVAVFKALQSLEPRAHLQDHMKDQNADMVLEYLYDDFKMYKS